MRCLTLALLLLTGCVHVHVRRLSRHERYIFVQVNETIAYSKHRAYRHLKRKAEHLECDKLIIEKLDEKYALGRCINE